MSDVIRITLANGSGGGEGSLPGESDTEDGAVILNNAARPHIKFGFLFV